MEARDFPVGRLLWFATLAECVVLGVAGIGLLVVPDLIVPLWPWPLSPFTARALGAVYLAAFVATVSLGIRPWWSPARVVVPMVAVFTTIMTVLSVAYLGRLHEWPVGRRVAGGVCGRRGHRAVVLLAVSRSAAGTVS